MGGGGGTYLGSGMSASPSATGGGMNYQDYMDYANRMPSSQQGQQQQEAQWKYLQKKKFESIIAQQPKMTALEMAMLNYLRQKYPSETQQNYY